LFGKNIDSGEGCIIGLEHYNLDALSLLLYATAAGNIHAWDLRTKSEAWVLHNPPNLGLISCFAIEPGRNWFVTGTTSGFFTCWDLRFRIPVRTWRHPSKSRLKKIVHYQAIKNSSWIFATAMGNPNEITVWDVETGTCKQLFRILARDEAPPLSGLKSPSDAPLTDYGVEELQRPTVVNINQNDAGIKNLLNPQDCTYLVTSGDDKRIRYWHLQNAINSYTICGLGKDQPKPRYSSHIYEHLTVYQEHPNADDSPESPSSNISKLRGPASPSVHHHESILDVKVMELPHRMIISGSRDGVIKVWK